MTTHLVIDDSVKPDKLLKKATLICRKFGIYHSTI